MTVETFKIEVLPLKNKLYRFALRMLNNTPEAEDVVQEIWMKLWDRRDQMEEVKNIEAFAFRMTRNLCLDKIKLKKPEYYDDREESSFRFEGADEGPDPERSLELKDTMERVNHIIGSLPERQQTLLQLRDIQGMEYEEISEVTGLEINAIRVNISRARKKLRDTLQNIQTI